MAWHPELAAGQESRSGRLPGFHLALGLCVAERLENLKRGGPRHKQDVWTRVQVIMTNRTEQDPKAQRASQLRGACPSAASPELGPQPASHTEKNGLSRGSEQLKVGVDQLQQTCHAVCTPASPRRLQTKASHKLGLGALWAWAWACFGRASWVFDKRIRELQLQRFTRIGTSWWKWKRSVHGLKEYEQSTLRRKPPT